MDTAASGSDPSFLLDTLVLCSAFMLLKIYELNIAFSPRDVIYL